MSIWSSFSLVALWSPVLLTVLFLVGAAYYVLTGPDRARWFANAGRVNARQRLSFYAGLLCLYAAFGSPLDLLGHLMFSVHMADMAIAYLMAPPLLLLGLPEWLLRPLAGRRFLAAFRWMAHPIVALLAFNALFSLYHMPAIHDEIMTNYPVHTLYYIVLLVAAFMMWWQVACPLPEANRLSDLKKMGYVFANGALLTPACALIIFSGSALYATYTDPQVWARALGYCTGGSAQSILAQFGGPGRFLSMSAQEDQQLGGVIMKLIQEFMYGAILAYIFYHWYRRENPKGGYDLNPEEGWNGA